MAAFGGFTMTTRGRALQSKAQAGTELVYTKAMIGDGSITSQSIVALMNLISPKMTLPITGIRPAPPDRAYIESKFDNQAIATGFYFREIGIYAQDPELGEILYAYANAGQNAEYIPPTGGPDIIEKSFRMNVFVGTATNITATIDSSLVFPTYDQVEEMINAIQVELVDSFESTDKTKAPTADALRAGLNLKQNTIRLADNYLAASVLVNAAADPNSGREYPNGVSMFKVTSSAGGWPAANGYVLTFRAGSGGYQIFYEMYTGTTQSDKTARQWTRSKRDSNAFWQAWAQTLTEVDVQSILSSAASTTTVKAAEAEANAKLYTDQKTWQKHKLTNDNGLSQNVSNGTMDDKKMAGNFAGSNVTGAPDTGFWYFEVLPYFTSDYVVQIARSLFSDSYRQRRFADGAWTPWTEDLFIYVSNGKASVRTAVTGKGGTVTAAGSVPTFAELVTGINTITPLRASRQVVSLSQSSYTGVDFGFVPKMVFVYIESLTPLQFNLAFTFDPVTNKLASINTSGAGTGVLVSSNSSGAAITTMTQVMYFIRTAAGSASHTIYAIG